MGEDKRNNIRVAIKALKKDSTNSLAQSRLRQEATFSFSNDTLPVILDFHEGEREIILVKEYIEGVTIDLFWKQLKNKQRIPFLQKFMYSLIPPLNILNSEKITHCDIKPENILVHGTADSFKVSLIDFGLSIDKHKPEQRSTLFPLGFAAPELLLNQLDIISQKSDIYALGILIWRLFTGKLPLTHPNPSIFTNLQLTHPLPTHESIPRKVFEILEKMTVKHSFKLPPNKMKKEDVIPLLQAAMNQRPTIEIIAKEFSALKTRRFWI
ncbi:MAG: protein kinase [Crocinitomicaceae bacterium]|nr:protein kinase [Crocinitomicaceae bacterium]